MYTFLEEFLNPCNLLPSIRLLLVIGTDRTFITNLKNTETNALNLTQRIHASFYWFSKSLTYMSAMLVLVSELGLNTEIQMDVNSVAQQQK